VCPWIDVCFWIDSSRGPIKDPRLFFICEVRGLEFSRNIILIGFRCTGKTTLGNGPASRSKRRLVDMDREMKKGKADHRFDLRNDRLELLLDQPFSREPQEGNCEDMSPGRKMNRGWWDRTWPERRGPPAHPYDYLEKTGGRGRKKTDAASSLFSVFYGG